MSYNNKTASVVIVGGGSAGWLTAAVLSASLRRRGLDDIRITLVESPSIGTIGVGEGTWPSMRSTLQTIGVSETDFIRKCDAAFKQGTCFVDWRGEVEGDSFLHPFTLPLNYHERNPVQDWLAAARGARFSDVVSPQGRLAPQGFAPKSITTPEYAFYLNYGYHLNAGKFAELLREHCLDNLGVEHWRDDVVAVHADAAGDITDLALASGSSLAGDFFIDCSGMHGLLLAGHYGVPLRPCGDVLFNDSALAVQVPYSDPAEPVASCTISTAREAGWIWDIGLSNRRGVGYVYSSAHSDDERAEAVLRDYLAPSLADNSAAAPEPRKISFTPGYREQFWVSNCVAIGMSAGFIEPLEASALVLVEMAAKRVAEDFPIERCMMGAAGRRFNQRFRQHWEMIIDFLKLHYVLSERRGAYWDDHRAARTIPATLQDRLALWRYRPPWHGDAVAADDLFPPASFQYILYGMGYAVDETSPQLRDRAFAAAARGNIEEVGRLTASLGKTLPGHRDLLERIHRFGLPTV